jgi:hypothetical protein
LPRLVMPPSRVFPPVEFCRGTKPSQAANSRPERNAFGSATVVAIAVAMVGPCRGPGGGKFFCHAEVPERRRARILQNGTISNQIR